MKVNTMENNKFTLEEIVAQLKKLNWVQYLGNDDYCSWKTDCSNRYVEINGRYIDIFAYSDEEKWGTYLTAEEFDLFNQLIQTYPEGRF